MMRLRVVDCGLRDQAVTDYGIHSNWSFTLPRPLDGRHTFATLVNINILRRCATANPREFLDISVSLGAAKKASTLAKTVSYIPRPMAGPVFYTRVFSAFSYSRSL
jgi:hypothetical protein